VVLGCWDRGRPSASCQLLFAVYLIFIATLKALSSIYLDSVTILQAETIRMILASFNQEHLKDNLLITTFKECKNQLHNILYLFESLVNDAVYQAQNSNQESNTVSIEKRQPDHKALVLTSCKS
jgi:hypothetical protein